MGRERRDPPEARLGGREYDFMLHAVREDKLATGAADCTLEKDEMVRREGCADA